MREIDYPVMAQAFATHRELGRLCDEGIAFAAVERSHRHHLRRRLEASPLARVLWINIAFHALACTIIDRSLAV